MVIYYCFFFSFFVKLASSVAIRKWSTKNSMNELRKHFPDFLWLLRDVMFQPKDENGMEISPKDYLMKRVLVQNHGFDESTSDKVGRAIITLFSNIDCVTLPPPSYEVDVIMQIEKNVDKLNPDFNKQISDLVEHLKQKVTTKKVFDSGEAVTGPLFACLAQQFVKDVNDPNNSWESTIKILVSDVQEKLTQEYTQEFTEAVKKASTNDGPLEEGDSSGEGQSTMTTIFGIHHALMMDKNAKLVEEVGRFCVTGATVGSELTQEQLLMGFRKKIIEVKKEMFRDVEGKAVTRDIVVGGVLFAFTQENYKRSQMYCSKVFDDLYKPIKDQILVLGDTYTFQTLQDDLQNLHEKYLLQAIGPAKWEVYDQKRIVIETVLAVFKRLAGYEERLMKAECEIPESNRRNQKMFEDISQLRQKLEDEASEHQENIKRMEHQHTEVIERLENEIKKRDEVEEQKQKEFMETKRI